MAGVAIFVCQGKGKGEDAANVRVIPGVRVVTVDDYQGEENDVVILSLVRSSWTAPAAIL